MSKLETSVMRKCWNCRIHHSLTKEFVKTEIQHAFSTHLFPFLLSPSLFFSRSFLHPLCSWTINSGEGQKNILQDKATSQ